MSDTADLVLELQKLQNSSRKALPFTVIGLAAVLIALFFSAIQLSSMRTDIADLDAKKAELTRAIADAQGQLAMMKSRIEAVTRDLKAAAANKPDASIPEPVANALNTAVQIDDTLARTSTQLQTVAAAAGVTPRIYFHIRDESQREWNRQLGDLLARKTGFIVPGIQRVTEGPKSNELRYFNKSDADQASEIAGVLRSAGLSVKTAFVSGYENSKTIRPKHYELWVTPDASLTPPAQ